MSFILDALKKAEDERQKNSAPGLHSVHAPLERTGRRFVVWPYPVVLALLINAGLFLWWLHPWRSAGVDLSVRAPSVSHSQEGSRVGAEARNTRKPAGTGSASEKAPETGRVASNEKDPASPPPPSAEATRQAAPAINSAPQGTPQTAASVELAERKSEPEESHPAHAVAKAKAEPGDQLPPKAAPARELPPETVARPEAAPSKQTPALAERSKLAMNEPQAESGKKRRTAKVAKPGKTNDSIKAEPRRPPAAAPLRMTETGPPLSDMLEEIDRLQANARQPEAVESNESVSNFSARSQPAQGGSGVRKAAGGDPAPENGLPRMEDLPVSILKDIPTLTLSMFVYSNNPADRMVNVNGRVVREGQEIVKGLELEQVTRNGVILKHKGKRFFKEAF